MLVDNTILSSRGKSRRSEKQVYYRWYVMLWKNIQRNHEWRHQQFFSLNRSSPALLVPRVSKVQAQMATILAEAAKTSAEKNVSVHVGAVEDIDFDNVQFK